MSLFVIIVIKYYLIKDLVRRNCNIYSRYFSFLKKKPLQFLLINFELVH